MKKFKPVEIWRRILELDWGKREIWPNVNGFVYCSKKVYVFPFYMYFNISKMMTLSFGMGLSLIWKPELHEVSKFIGVVHKDLL